MTPIASRGSSPVPSLRLCSRAPETTIWWVLATTSGSADEQTFPSPFDRNERELFHMPSATSGTNDPEVSRPWPTRPPATARFVLQQRRGQESVRALAVDRRVDLV